MKILTNFTIFFRDFAEEDDANSNAKNPAQAAKEMKEALGMFSHRIVKNNIFWPQAF